MAEQSSISFYSKINYVNSQETIPLDIFLDGVLEGQWQDTAILIRGIKHDDPKEQLKLRRLAKEEHAESVTISGKFKQRYDDKIDSHSGYIGIDIDHCNVNKVKEQLLHDPYVFSIFMSIGGDGICIIFKINPSKHKEAFQGISEYLHRTYNLLATPLASTPVEHALSAGTPTKGETEMQ